MSEQFCMRGREHAGMLRARSLLCLGDALAPEPVKHSQRLMLRRAVALAGTGRSHAQAPRPYQPLAAEVPRPLLRLAAAC